MVNKLNAQRTINPALSGALFYGLFWGAVGVYIPFINVYFLELGLSGQQIGLLAALVPLLTLTVGPIIALVADQLNSRVVFLRYALIGAIVAYFLLGLPRVNTFQNLLPLMVLQALFYAPIIPLADTVITQMASQHQLNYGSLRLFGSLIFAITTISFGYVWQLIPYQWMFIIAGLFLLPAVLVSTQLEEEQRPSLQQRPPIWQLLKSQRLVVIFATTFLTGFGLNLAFTFDGIYMSGLGGNKIYVGLMFGAAACAELPAMQFSQQLSRRFKGHNVFIAGLLFLFAAMIGYLVSTTPAMLLVAAITRGVGFGLTFISGVQLVNQFAPPAWVSTAQSLRQAGTFGLAALIANPAGGGLYDLVGLGSIFSAAAGAFLLAILLIISQQRSFAAN